MPVGGFKWVENTSPFNKDFIENYNEDSTQGHLHELQNDLPSLTFLKEWKLKKLKILWQTFMMKKNVTHIWKLKEALNLGYVLTKVHIAIEFNQEVWLKSYIDTNTELRKNAKHYF